MADFFNKRRKHARDETVSPSSKKTKFKKRNSISLSSKGVSIFDQINFRERGNAFIPESWNLFSKFGNLLEWYIPKDCKGAPVVSVDNGNQGAIFNLEFSPNNQYLVAACEKRTILLFDPCSQKKVRTIQNAHREGVNCVTFLDERTFVTCSDDKNVILWDIRNTENNIFSLQGHKSWVKSINYHKQSKQLVSSGFDDTVRLWNITDFSNKLDIKSKTVMKIPFLTRTKLMCHNTTNQKLVAGTNTGLLFVVHNLKFETLRKDTLETMKLIKNVNLEFSDLPVVDKFTEKNVPNRIEFITEFVKDEFDPWCIASVQIHPKEESILSRYTTKNRRNAEWSTVHSLYKGNYILIYNYI